MERMSSLVKDARIKALEDLVIKLGYDPSNIKVAEEMIKNKNVDIQALRKQLKIPTTEHPQAKEVGLIMMGRHRSRASPSGSYGIRALGLSCVGPPNWSTDLDYLRASNLGVGGLSCPHFCSSS